MRWQWQLGYLVGVLSCVDGLVPSPFAAGGSGVDAGIRMADASPVGATDVPVLGGPCLDDAQCDDGLDCTFGACDSELGRCRFTPDDARCADGLFCNGIEICHAQLGCRAGPPPSCSDSTPCTVDTCDEAIQACSRVDRDSDGDGDVDGNCQPGKDCNDLDPLVSSTSAELCSNTSDDDCDGDTDEAECLVPQFDTCADGFEVSAAGTYELSPAGALLDYGASCATGGPGLRELVLLITAPAGPVQDIDLVVRSSAGNLSLARMQSCGGATELECLRGSQSTAGDRVARLRLRSATPGIHVVYLFTDAGQPVQLSVSHEPATLPPANLSCAQRSVIEPGELVGADLAFSGEPLEESACPTDWGDLFYEFALTETADVLGFAQSVDGLSQPRLSLRTSACLPLDSELACSQAEFARFHARALPAGTYVLALSASGPTNAQLTLELRPPSSPPPTDQCASAPILPPNRTEATTFVGHIDDIAAGCIPGRVDAARALQLDSASDVLVVGRFAGADEGAVALAGAECRAQDTLACAQAISSLARVSRRGLSAGRYNVVVESAIGLPGTLTVAVRPARPPTLVPGADGCLNPLSIGDTGGFFQGNTVNAAHDYSASCDFATPVGAPDQLLRLVLDTERRVIFDMRGSNFDTLLNVRQGPACPGEEVEGGCSVMGEGDRSYLDRNLPAGEYFVQIDGYAGASGTWFLDVFVMDP